MNRTGLKYYLRALGTGMIVTALLMGYSQKGQAQMTDEEIRRRAAQLGMTEPQGVLAELATEEPAADATPGPSPTEEPTAWATASPSPTMEPTAEATASPPPTMEPIAEATASPPPTMEPIAEATASPSPTMDPIAEATASPSPTMEPTAEATASPPPTMDPIAEATASPSPVAEPAEDAAVLVVTRGESSVTVSKNLEELGLVEDYRAFDRYLCEIGYDHSISTGTYEISLGTTEEEIARIICKIQ